MDLKTYMDNRSLTGEKMAEIIGDVTGAAVLNWKLGSRMPSPEIAERIVTVQDMHETRLEYMASNPKPSEAA
jgi:hypothetical protein